MSRTTAKTTPSSGGLLTSLLFKQIGVLLGSRTQHLFPARPSSGCWIGFIFDLLFVSTSLYSPSVSDVCGFQLVARKHEDHHGTGTERRDREEVQGRGLDATTGGPQVLQDVENHRRGPDVHSSHQQQRDERTTARAKADEIISRHADFDLFLLPHSTTRRTTTTKPAAALGVVQSADEEVQLHLAPDEEHREQVDTTAATAFLSSAVSAGHVYSSAATPSEYTGVTYEQIGNGWCAKAGATLDYLFVAEVTEEVCERSCTNNAWVEALEDQAAWEAKANTRESWTAWREENPITTCTGYMYSGNCMTFQNVRPDGVAHTNTGWDAYACKRKTEMIVSWDSVGQGWCGTDAGAITGEIFVSNLSSFECAQSCANNAWVASLGDDQAAWEQEFGVSWDAWTQSKPITGTCTAYMHSSNCLIFQNHVPTRGMGGAFNEGWQQFPCMKKSQTEAPTATTSSTSSTTASSSTPSAGNFCDAFDDSRSSCNDAGPQCAWGMPMMQMEINPNHPEEPPDPQNSQWIWVNVEDVAPREWCLDCSLRDGSDAYHCEGFSQGNCVYEEGTDLCVQKPVPATTPPAPTPSSSSSSSSSTTADPAGEGQSTTPTAAGDTTTSTTTTTVDHGSSSPQDSSSGTGDSSTGESISDSPPAGAAARALTDEEAAAAAAAGLDGAGLPTTQLWLIIGGIVLLFVICGVMVAYGLGGGHHDEEHYYDDGTEQGDEDNYGFHNNDQSPYHGGAPAYNKGGASVYGGGQYSTFYGGKNKGSYHDDSYESGYGAGADSYYSGAAAPPRGPSARGAPINTSYRAASARGPSKAMGGKGKGGGGYNSWY